MGRAIFSVRARALKTILKLAEAGDSDRPSKKRGIFDEWKAFVTRHKALGQVVPASIGLSGNNAAVMRSINGDYLPAAPIDRIVDMPREKTAWHEVDPLALSALIRTIRGYEWLATPSSALLTNADVVSFAEHMLEASCPKWLMGWRDICRATDERTLIASALPRSGCGDTLLLLFPTVAERRTIAGLLACLDSIPGDYIARQKIGGTHLKYNVFKQLAILPPSAFTQADLDS